MKKETKLLSFACAVFFSALPARAQLQPKPTVWIDPATPYANYLEAAVLKKHTPMTFVTNKESAQYIATLSSEQKNGSTAKAIFLGYSGAQHSLSMSVSDEKTGAVVFSYTCEKHEAASWQSASECLAKHWTNFVEKGKP